MKLEVGFWPTVTVPRKFFPLLVASEKVYLPAVEKVQLALLLG